MRCNHRDAYTFVELLIVIAIIGVLVALLLPAVQAAREAARRVSCANNLEQLIIAVHHYEMMHGVYPPGTIDNSRPILNQPAGYHHNWLIQLLPFLEQRNAYRHVDRTAGVYDPTNRPVRRLDLKLLRCPSSSWGGPGYGDYAGVHNDVEAPIDVDNNGVFFLNSRIGYDDLIDGSSQTLFLGEKITLAGDLGWMSGTRATLRNAGTPINWGSLFGAGWRWRAEPKAAYPDRAPFGVHSGEQGTEQYEPAEALLLYGLLLSEVDEPDGEEATRSVAVARRPTNRFVVVGGFSSRHPGGAQFALGDGSVRFLAETIDCQLFRRLAHRADAKLLEDLPY